MTRINNLKSLACGAALALVASTSAHGQSLPPLNQSDVGWRHSIGVYAFAALRADGTSTIAGLSAPIDLTLSDILDVLDFAAAGRYEAWNGDFGVILDANYVSLTGENTAPGPLGTSVSVNSRQKWLALLAAYRVGDGTYGANNQRYTFDIQGGARYNSLRQTIDISSPAPNIPSSLGGDEGWFEPVIGARGMWRLNERWTTVASIDLGGFGAGGNDLQVGANFGFEYQPWKNTSLTFGYRYFSMDYSDTLDDGVFAYDVKQHGPYFGLKYYFN